MEAAVLSFSWFLILATLLPLIPRESWWLRLLDFPRPQITVLSLGCAAAFYFLRDPKSMPHTVTWGLLILCSLYQAWEMAAYTRLKRVQCLNAESSDPARRITLLAANVLMTNRNYKEFLKLQEMYQPDVIILAEPDKEWETALTKWESIYSWRIRCPLPNTYGLLLYSRLPLRDELILFRVEDEVPSFRATVQLRCGDQFELHAVHPRPPQIGVSTVGRDAELVLVAKELRTTDRPIIVTGDLNDVAWSHTTRLFLRISGLLDPRVGRAFFNTFHAHNPIFRWPLDHLFHSRAFRLVRMERCPKTASDHFPIFVELSYEPEVRHEQEKPVADEQDLAEGQEKVENAKSDELR